MIKYSTQPGADAKAINKSPTAPIVTNDSTAAKNDLDLDSDNEDGTD